METKTQVTVSYSRKLNHQLYGGNSFENSDFFCSMQIDAEQGQEAIDAAFVECKFAVMKQIGEEIETFQGGHPPQVFTEYIQAWVAGRKRDVEEFEAFRSACSPSQRDIVNAIRKGRNMAKRDNKKQDENNGNGAENESGGEELQVIHT